MKQLTRAFAIVAVCVCFAGCTTLRTVADSEASAKALAGSAKGGLRSGDTVVVDTRDGHSATLAVTAVDAEGLTGKDEKTGQQVRVLWSDTQKVQKQELDSTKTVGVILLVIAGVALWAYAAVNSMFN